MVANSASRSRRTTRTRRLAKALIAAPSSPFNARIDSFGTSDQRQLDRPPRRPGDASSGGARPHTDWPISHALILATPSHALFLARIVRRIDVSNGEGSLTVDLDDSLARRPGIVVHPGRRLGKTARPQGHAFLRVELVSHTDVEYARKHRDVF